MIQIESINFTPDGVRIAYYEDRDVHESGILMMRTLDVPHSKIPNEFFDDLGDSVRQIIDHAHVIMRNPPAQI